MSNNDRDSSSEPGRHPASEGVEASVWSLLRCPRCQSSLEKQGTEVARLVCTRCGKGYPFFLGVPLVTARPEEWLERWRKGLGRFAQWMTSAERKLQVEFFDEDLSERSRNRVRQVIGALGRHREEVLGLLGRAGIEPMAPAEKAEPGEYSPEPYFAHLLRDYAWPPEVNEVEESWSRLRAVLPDDFEPGATLVLGAGTGRLAWQLAARYPGEAPVLALDVDPLLLLVTQLLLDGEQLALTELPAHPRVSNAVAKTHTLNSGLPRVINLRLLLADGLDPPLARGQWDTVVTPWMVDEVPEDAAVIPELVRSLLREGGSFVCSGPFLYDNAHTKPSLRYCVDEFFELVERAGFEVTSKSYGAERYMASPLSSRSRIENVLYLHARKASQRRVERPEVASYVKPGAGASVSIPVPPGLHDLNLSPKEVAEVAALIDGSRNVRQITSLLVGRGVLVDDGTAESAVRGCLKIILERLGERESK